MTAPAPSAEEKTCNVCQQTLPLQAFKTYYGTREQQVIVDEKRLAKDRLAIWTVANHREMIAILGTAR